MNPPVVQCWVTNTWMTGFWMMTDTGAVKDRVELEPLLTPLKLMEWLTMLFRQGGGKLKVSLELYSSLSH